VAKIKSTLGTSESPDFSAQTEIGTEQNASQTPEI